MASTNDFMRPGWTTSKPGDMKNPSGMPTRFSRTIEPVPRTAFDLDLRTINGGMSRAEFEREYQATFANADVTAKPTKDAMEAMKLAMASSMTKTATNQEHFNAWTDQNNPFTEQYRQTPGYMPPKINRDTPESSAEDAW